MMILVNGREVISNVIVREDGTFETTDVPGRFWNSNQMEPINKDRFSDSRIPYIEIPTTVSIKEVQRSSYLYYGGKYGDVDDLECETGYINTSNGIKERISIIIGNVEIKKLLIKTLANTKVYSWGASREEYLELDFHYEFTIFISNEHGEKEEHTFGADSHNEIRPYKTKEYNIWPIKTLFRDIVPTINNFISAKHPVRNINYVYLEQLLPQKQEIDMSVHPFNFSDALDVIYNMQLIEDRDGTIEIEFGKDLLPYMNRYIVSLINSLLNIRLHFDESSETYRSFIPRNISYPKNIISLHNYLQCLLYIGIYENFDAKQAQNYYLVLPSSDGTDNFETVDSSYENLPSESFLIIYDFIANMEVSHVEDGQYRAGRDDREWKEKTFIFPFTDKLENSDAIVDDINRILGIKLQYQEKFESEYSWDSEKNHPARYFYFEQYDDDYIAGMACTRHDIGSDKLKKESFYELLDYFIKDIITKTRG